MNTQTLNKTTHARSLNMRRLFAYLIDYLLIMLYALVLLGAALLLKLDERITGPSEGQIISFFTLTLPVFFYFYLSERNRGATLGKKLQKIKVVNGSYPNRVPSILKRNILKMLPWEIAHIGIHWLFYKLEVTGETPLWVYICLIVPQITMLSYGISVLVYKGKSSLYDRVAGTAIATVS